MIAPFIAILSAMLVVMTAAWGVQRVTANGGWVDVFWSFGTGASCSAAILLWAADGAQWRRLLLVALVAVWSLRLGTYIAGRVRGGPEDVRYTAFRRRWGASFNRRMIGLVLIQAPVSATLGLAIVYAARQPDPAFGVADGLGLSILFGAIVGETVADRQMRRFKADPVNRGQVCDRGLWAWTRHPNYLFEALLWLAFPVIAADPANPWSLLSWLAPVVMAALLRYGSGVPPLEAAMLESKGDAYRRYQQRVPALLPRWPAKVGS
jgi:steroid 5-alpha reductase family enzyme